MSTETINFFSKSKSVVEGFLQSVVIVDDRAFDEIPEARPIETVDPESFPEIGQMAEILDLVSTTVETESDEADIQDETHNLDAKSVIDSFAKKGIVCAVIAPEPHDFPSLAQTVLKLTLKTDIVILDWSLGQDKGQKALNILRKIFSSNSQNPQQLRLIVIYTANPKIINVSDQIKELLLSFSPEITDLDNGFTYEALSIRVVILAKEDAKIPKIYDDFRVSFSSLADRVTEEFTKMATGLVSNAILLSLTKIRANTYRLLQKFSNNLDAPYLTHRVMLTTPSDAEELLTYLIARDIQGILEEESIGRMAGLDAITLWVKERTQNNKVFKHKSNQKANEQEETFDEEQILGLLSDGVSCWSHISKIGSPKKPHTLKLTEMFNGDKEKSRFLDENFACLTLMRSCYEGYFPFLTLGTVLKREKDNLVLICLEPSCDTVRLTGAKAFPFLPAKQVDDANSRFDLVFEIDRLYSRFLIDKKLSNMAIIVFEPEAGQDRIKAIKNDKKYCFKAINDDSFMWIGELRQEFALRITNELSANFTRIGVDQSEWLRRWSGE